MNNRQKILQAMLVTAREKTAQGAAPQDILQTVRQTRDDAKDALRHGITIQDIQENKRRARGTLQEVMVYLGTFEERVVHTSRKHPQVGYIHYEGKRQRVCIGFWGDCPVWKLVDDDEEEYTYCLHKTMRIDEDPDYCGGEGEEGKGHSV